MGREAQPLPACGPVQHGGQAPGTWSKDSVLEDMRQRGVGDNCDGLEAGGGHVVPVPTGSVTGPGVP